MNLKEWIAPDGLLCLNINNFKPNRANPDGLLTCDNENGILYLAELIYSMDRDLNFLEVQKRLEHPTAEGHFYRNAGGWPRNNSHDNYLGHCAGSIYVDDSETFKKVIKNFPILNDIDPGTIILKRGTPSGIHQGSDWFCYFLGARATPKWWMLIWYLLSILYAAVVPLQNFHVGSRCIMWMKIRMTNRRLLTFKYKYKWIVSLVNNFADLWMKDMKGGYELYFRLRYSSDHPLHKLGEKYETFV